MLAGLKVNLSREEIFARKFTGQEIEESDIFKSLRTYSPSGKQKSISITPLNLIKFEQFLVSAQNFIDASN